MFLGLPQRESPYPSTVSWDWAKSWAAMRQTIGTFGKDARREMLEIRLATFARSLYPGRILQKTCCASFELSANSWHFRMVNTYNKYLNNSLINRLLMVHGSWLMWGGWVEGGGPRAPARLP